MKLSIFSFLLVGVAVAAPAEPAWKYARGDFNDTNATVTNARQLRARDSGHAKLPVWHRRFDNTTANPQGHVARRANLTVSVSETIKERTQQLSTKRESNFPKFGVY